MAELAWHGLIDLESASLAEVEAFIAPRARWFVQVGHALLAIRERRLYLDAGYDDFKTYCRDRWEMDDSRARQLCDAAQVAELTAGSTDGTTVPPVENEAQARVLRDLITQPDELNAVWREAAERGQGKPTAALIREVRRDRQRRNNPAPPPPPPGPKPPPFPAQAHRMFTVITQAAEEVAALGGAEILREQAAELSAEVRDIWMEGFGRVARLCGDLAAACEEQ